MLRAFVKELIVLSAVCLLVTGEAGAQLRKKKPAQPKLLTPPPQTATVVAPATSAAPPAAEKPPEAKWYESVKITGMVRLRPEIKENFNFDADQRYNFVGQKVWLSAEKEFSDKSKLVITLQDARVWGGQSPTITDTSTEQQATDIREAYVQLKNFLWTPFELKLGRQKLEFGEQMLIGSLDWANVGRSFDGFKLTLDSGINNLQLFSTVIQESNSNDLNNPVSGTNKHTQGMYLSGFYNQLKLHRGFMIDLFGFARNQDMDGHSNQLYTGGMRLSNRTEAGNKSPGEMWFDYSLEGAYQGGQRQGKEIQAYGAVGFIGVKFNLGVKMRIGGQGAYASGDTDANDGKYETFDPLYPTPHYQFGFADMTSWRNLTGGGADYTIWFTPDLSLKLDYWYAMRTTGSDSWYAIGGSANASTALGGERELYQEADVMVNYKPRDYLMFQAGYAYAMRGKAMNLANKSGDYQFGYLMSTFVF